MNYLDLILGGLLVFGLVKGIMKGLFVELASLVAIVAGIYGAIKFSFYVSDFLEQQITLAPHYIKLISFAITFIGIIVGVSFLGKLLTKVAKFAALGILNRILGGAFGLLKLAFIASAIIMFVGPLTEKLGILKKETIDNSILYKPVKMIAPAIYPAIMKKYNEEKENLPQLTPNKEEQSKEEEPKYQSI